jgi:cell fate (sporulation/competence/biofilm development) regulator YmcA (YheA/YmcA/DUF963 family)
MMVTETTHPILIQAQRIAERLQSLEEVQRYQAAEEQINKSQTVQNYIETIKRKQKELVHAKHFQKHNYVRQLEQELDQLNQEFDQLPIVREYQLFQVHVNDMLQSIQHTLADLLSERLQIETGGTVASGCGNGGPCGCKK